MFEEILCLDLPLSEKLELLSAHIDDNKVDTAQAYSTLVAQLQEAGAGSSAPRTGDVMPAFILPGSNGQIIESSKLLETGPLVISFNRGNWCSFCKLELAMLQSILPEVQSCGGTIVSIMPEHASCTKLVREELRLEFEVLSDLDNGFALACNLMISLGQNIRSLLAKAGVHSSQPQSDSTWFVPIPATFVVASSSEILTAWTDPDFRKRLDGEDVLSALRANRC